MSARSDLRGFVAAVIEAAIKSAEANGRDEITVADLLAALEMTASYDGFPPSWG